MQERLNFSTELLNILTSSGMPPHELKLNVGAIIMLLRNLNTKRGLCNGTFLIATNLEPNLIIAEVLMGRAKKQLCIHSQNRLGTIRLEHALHPHATSVSSSGCFRDDDKQVSRTNAREGRNLPARTRLFPRATVRCDVNSNI